MSSIMVINDWDGKIMNRCRQEKKNYFDLAKKYEHDFHVDMGSLGILRPTTITRVTDCIKEIICMIQDMVGLGLAYERQGSVFMDMTAYDARAGANCRLPREVVDRESAKGTEDDTTTTVSHLGSRRDFTLWVPSAPDEPHWISPWGPGRPDWNLAWSASLSTAVLKKFMSTEHATFFSGGFLPNQNVDLDGTLPIWIKSGELMNWPGSARWMFSKNDSRQFRLLCLLRKYNVSITRRGLMPRVLNIEKTLSAFFELIKVKRAEYPGVVLPTSLQECPAAFKLQRRLQKSKVRLDTALKDDFDTPVAMKILMELIRATLSSLTKCDTDCSTVVFVACEVAQYATRILQLFGVLSDSVDDGAITVAYEIGGMTRRDSGLAPILDVVARFVSVYHDESKHVKDTFDAIDSMIYDLRKVGVHFKRGTDEDGEVAYTWIRDD